MSASKFYSEKLLFKKTVFDAICHNDNSSVRHYLKDEHNFGRNDFWKFYEIAVYQQNWSVALLILDEFIDNPFEDACKINHFIDDLVYYFQEKSLWNDLRPLIQRSLRWSHLKTKQAKSKALEFIVRVSAFDYLDANMKHVFLKIVTTSSQLEANGYEKLLTLALSLGSFWCARKMLQNFASLSKPTLGIHVNSRNADECLVTCKMLYYSGLPLRNLNLVQGLNDPKESVVSQWVNKEKSNVMNLKCLCRIKIRNEWGKASLKLLKFYEIPQMFIDYLKLNDVF